MILLDTNVLLRAYWPHLDADRFVGAIALERHRGLRPYVLGGQLRELYAVLTRSGANGLGLEPGAGVAAIARVREAAALLPDEPLWFDAWLVLVSDSQIRGVAAHDA